ncbi:hypothetical protein PInf_025429 [Phytophthora infestans]|nr:hypothetical protein PInf_025429 [Phytophthora infestans]
MNSVTGPLLPNGYLAVGLVLPDRVIPTLLAEAKARTYTGVFNRVGGCDDSYRQQSRVDSAALSPALLELRKALAVVIGMLHPGWKPGIFSFMRSKPGEIEQEARQDYQGDDIARARAAHPGGVPASMNPDGASNRLKRKREGKEGVFKCELCPNVEYPVASSLRSHKSRVHGSGQ